MFGRPSRIVSDETVSASAGFRHRRFERRTRADDLVSSLTIDKRRSQRRPLGTQPPQPGGPSPPAASGSVTPLGYNELMPIVQHQQPTHRACAFCAKEFAVVRRPGRPRLYCNQVCRQRAYEHRHGFEHERTVRPLPAQAKGETWTGTGYERSMTGLVRRIRQDARDANVGAPGRPPTRNTVRAAGGATVRPTLQRPSSRSVQDLHSGSDCRIRCASASPHPTSSPASEPCSTRSANAASTRPTLCDGSRPNDPLAA